MLWDRTVMSFDLEALSELVVLPLPAGRWSRFLGSSSDRASRGLPPATLDRLSRWCLRAASGKFNLKASAISCRCSAAGALRSEQNAVLAISLSAQNVSCFLLSISISIANYIAVEFSCPFLTAKLRRFDQPCLSTMTLTRKPRVL